MVLNRVRQVREQGPRDQRLPSLGSPMSAAIGDRRSNNRLQRTALLAAADAGRYLLKYLEINGVLR